MNDHIKLPIHRRLFTRNKYWVSSLHEEDEIWGTSEVSYDEAELKLDEIIISIENDTGDDIEWWNRVTLP
jgi:hypothetical protein